MTRALCGYAGHLGEVSDCPVCKGEQAWAEAHKAAKEVDGVKYAPGVEPAADGPHAELEEAIKDPARWRVTGMIDEDLYKELRRRHGLTPGGTSFDETLNNVICVGIYASAKEANNGGT
jgi:hypothetical protein